MDVSVKPYVTPTSVPSDSCVYKGIRYQTNNYIVISAKNFDSIHVGCIIQMLVDNDNVSFIVQVKEARRDNIQKYFFIESELFISKYNVDELPSRQSLSAFKRNERVCILFKASIISKDT